MLQAVQPFTQLTQCQLAANSRRAGTQLELCTGAASRAVPPPPTSARPFEPAVYRNTRFHHMPVCHQRDVRLRMLARSG